MQSSDSWLMRHEQAMKIPNLATGGMWVGMWVETRHGLERLVFASDLAEGAGFEPAGGY